jgi:hypothetical protein
MPRASNLRFYTSILIESHLLAILLKTVTSYEGMSYPTEQDSTKVEMKTFDVKIYDVKILYLHLA